MKVKYVGIDGDVFKRGDVLTLVADDGTDYFPFEVSKLGEKSRHRLYSQKVEPLNK